MTDDELVAELDRRVASLKRNLQAGETFEVVSDLVNLSQFTKQARRPYLDRANADLSEEK